MPYRLWTTPESRKYANRWFDRLAIKTPLGCLTILLILFLIGVLL